ncbi:uncharacterized protein LOC110839019 isoform X2 [Zootermopsis nevadensis]|nr:uncharacterized protein LOC110839019 isoform X2 [Zootermopsis nevadensis]
MVSRGHWLLRQVEEFMDLANHMYTFLAFTAGCCLVPGAIALCIAVTSARRFWLGLLKRRFPSLEFVRNMTLRTATDTMRNQGIVTLLLTVKGKFELALIKQRLEENILNRRDNEGKLMFPHLQTALTTRWGRYAWEKPSSFSLDNHLVVGSALFRGRSVNDWNIQECVSDIVSKYLPHELSPWQITIIPSNAGTEDRFYLLVRIHHLLLSEDCLGLGDLLLLEPERPTIFKRRLGEDDENPTDDEPTSSNSPLTGLSPTPVAIPRLYNIVRDLITHRWTQIVATYDPAQNPQILKSPPGIQTCTILIFITAVSIFKELLFLAKKTDMSLYRKILNINSTILTEVEKRQCTPKFLSVGIINSLRPKQLFFSWLSVFWRTGYICAVTVPLFAITEFWALVSRKTNYSFSETTAESSFNYWSLFLASIKEAVCIMTIIYTAPRMLIQELIISHHGPKHQLQTVSLCGRKVVAWSDPISLDIIRKISSSVGASTTEILVSAISGALREYFRQFCLPVPESVLTTARFFPLEGLMRHSRVDDRPPIPSGRGLICLPLPTSPVYDDPRESVQEIQRIISEARQKQPAIYQASLWQLDGGYITRILPSLAVRLVLNHLSRRYAVALTQVAPEMSDESRNRLIWGQEVESALYWRPPQSNICLSLTLMKYGDTVRLGVMVDSMIAPQHTVMASGFLQQVYQLAALAGVPRDRTSLSTSSHVYQPNIPPEGITSAHGSNTSVSSASEELLRLAASSPDLNISTSSGTTRSNSPESSLNSRLLNEEIIFPFTD